MFGFIIGTVCLIGFMKVVRHGRWHGGGWRGRGPGGWQRRWLYGVFEKLDATPGQEKVILSAVDDVRAAMEKARQAWPDRRKDFAETFRRDAITDDDLNRVMAGVDDHLDEVRKVAGDAMRRIHEALDEKQRARIAEMFDGGRGRWSWV